MERSKGEKIMNSIKEKMNLKAPEPVSGNCWLVQFPGQPLAFINKKQAFEIVRAVNSCDANELKIKILMEHLHQIKMTARQGGQNALGAIPFMVDDAIKQAEGK